jgi:hypothetical protein
MNKLRLGVPVCAIAAIAVAVACGSGSSDDNVLDASPDGTTTDAKADAKADTGVDAKPDSTVDAGSDADAETDAQVDAPDDSPTDTGIDVIIIDSGSDSSTCGSKLGFGYVSLGDGGGCGTGEDYSCSTDSYEILCECPSAVCTCYKNKADAGTVTFTGCPSCSTPNFSAIASSCGIPY